MVWCGGVWCGVVWCGVIWCGVGILTYDCNGQHAYNEGKEHTQADYVLRTSGGKKEGREGEKEAER